MIKAVIFDLGGVVFRDGTKYAVKELERDYNFPKEKALKIFRGREAKEFRDDNLTPEQFWKFVSSQIPNNLTAERIRQIWYKNYEPMEGMFALLHSLKSKVKLGIISGNIRERIDFLEDKYHFRELFDVEVYSFDMNMNKPNREVWDKAVELLEVKPEECIFIDDMQEFVEIAKDLGFTSILFTNADDLRRVFDKEIFLNM